MSRVGNTDPTTKQPLPPSSLKFDIWDNIQSGCCFASKTLHQPAFKIEYPLNLMLHQHQPQSGHFVYFIIRDFTVLKGLWVTTLCIL